MKLKFVDISRKAVEYQVQFNRDNKTEDVFISYGVKGDANKKARFNALGYELIDLLNHSSKHNAIVTSKVNYITGGGLISKDSKDPATQNFLMKPNEFEDANSILEKVATDYELQGGYYLQLVFGKVGGKLVRLYHVPFEKMQPNETATKFKFVDDKTKPNNYTIYEAYDGENVGTKIMYVSTYRPGSGALTLPEYFASLKYIQIDKEIANFNLNNIESGFSAGTMIVLFEGTPNPDEEESITEQLKASTTGSDAAGNTWVYFAKAGDEKPEVIPLNGNDLVDKFAQLNEQCRDEIFVGHKVVTPMLFGVRVQGTLGGRNEILEAYELLNAGYIEPKQKTLKASFNICNRLFGGTDSLMIEPVKPMGIDYVGLFNAGVITNRKTVQKELGLPIEETVPTELLSSQREGVQRDNDWVQFEQFGESADNYQIIHEIEIESKEHDNG